MNSEARALVKARKAEVEAFPGGETGFRRHALSNIRVKTVVKESHLSAVNCIAYNAVDGQKNKRLFATVGKDQATVYDDEHMGDHVAVVVQFNNGETKHTRGGDLDVCAWVNSDGWQQHPNGDAVLAVAGGDKNISLISVVESRVMHLLKGHTSTIVDLCGCQEVPGLLASLSKDGEVRVWDAASGDPGASVATAAVSGATSLCLSPDGSHAIVGTRTGQLVRLLIAGLKGTRTNGSGSGRRGLTGASSSSSGGTRGKRKASAVAAASEEGEQRPREVLLSREALQLPEGHTHGGTPVDCVAYLSPGRLASKSADGRMHVWVSGGAEGAAGAAGAALRAASSWRVPSCSLDTSLRMRFGFDLGGQFIAVGNSQGDLYVYEAETGNKISHVEPLKVSAPVRSCSISSDCRHVLAVMGNGFVFRYQYIQPPAKKEGEEGASEEAAEGSDKENTDGNAPA